jgi:putative sigma-54 modulation protein
MELQVKSRNAKLSDDLNEYIQRRASKLDRVNERITDAKLELRESPAHRDGVRFTAQLTISTRRAILRAEDTGTDIRATIDMAIDKMNRRIKRFHERKIGRGRREAVSLGELAVTQAEALETPDLDGDDAASGAVARVKRFKIQPMDSEEAIEQLELLGHDFFVFFNPDSGTLNVLYRRKDGDYGVIEPDLA